MPLDKLIEILKTKYEAQTDWGASENWTNQDFINLSERIHEQTGAKLSHVTLKRIWGKVKYESMPNTYTLNILAQFIGFSDWRSFVSAQLKTGPEDLANFESKGEKPSSKKAQRLLWLLIPGTLLIALILFAFLNTMQSKVVIKNTDYHFSSKTVITSGLPNTVIFNYEASKAPEDSVIIQQSWDKKLQTRVSKNDHLHTSIYYYPDFYFAKLIVNKQIVKQHELFIKSNGWMAAVDRQPVPVYFSAEEVMRQGKMSLSPATIESHKISMQPVAPNVLFCNVKDFGEIFSDDFEFETSLKNDFQQGANICQQTQIYLLCKGTAIWIPLCSKGCSSTLDLLFTDYRASGKKDDLSAFGVDFNHFINLKIESHHGKAQIFIDGKMVYTIDRNIFKSKIIGIYYRFQGTGSVDFVRLGNSKVKYIDEF